MSDVKEISVTDLKQKIDKNEDFTLIDVREEHEFHLCNIEGATLMPLGGLHDELGSLNKSHEYVIQCRSGKRSASACELMQDAGFTNVVNLAGGILAWADEIDSSMPSY
jgi:rhodanese-related sulfurtransferase